MSDYHDEQALMDQMADAQVESYLADQAHEQWLRKHGFPVSMICGCYSTDEHKKGWCRDR